MSYPESTDDGAGARLREARRRRGMTQQDLADAIGVSRSAVAQWETDRAGQVRGNLARIASALGVSVDYLVHGQTSGAEGTSQDATELALLRLYREMAEADRQWLLQTAIRLVRHRRPDRTR